MNPSAEASSASSISEVITNTSSSSSSSGVAAAAISGPAFSMNSSLKNSNNASGGSGSSPPRGQPGDSHPADVAGPSGSMFLTSGGGGGGPCTPGAGPAEQPPWAPATPTAVVKARDHLPADIDPFDASLDECIRVQSRQSGSNLSNNMNGGSNAVHDLSGDCYGVPVAGVGMGASGSGSGGGGSLGQAVYYAIPLHGSHSSSSSHQQQQQQMSAGMMPSPSHYNYGNADNVAYGAGGNTIANNSSNAIPSSGGSHATPTGQRAARAAPHLSSAHSSPYATPGSSSAVGRALHNSSGCGSGVPHRQHHHQQQQQQAGAAPPPAIQLLSSPNPNPNQNQNHHRVAVTAGPTATPPSASIGGGAMAALLSGRSRTPEEKALREMLQHMVTLNSILELELAERGGGAGVRPVPPPSQRRHQPMPSSSTAQVSAATPVNRPLAAAAVISARRGSAQRRPREPRLPAAGVAASPEAALGATPLPGFMAPTQAVSQLYRYPPTAAVLHAHTRGGGEGEGEGMGHHHHRIQQQQQEPHRHRDASSGGFPSGRLAPDAALGGQAAAAIRNSSRDANRKEKMEREAQERARRERRRQQQRQRLAMAPPPPRPTPAPTTTGRAPQLRTASRAESRGQPDREGGGGEATATATGTPIATAATTAVVPVPMGMEPAAQQQQQPRRTRSQGLRTGSRPTMVTATAVGESGGGGCAAAPPVAAAVSATPASNSARRGGGPRPFSVHRQPHHEEEATTTAAVRTRKAPALHHHHHHRRSLGEPSAKESGPTAATTTGVGPAATDGWESAYWSQSKLVLQQLERMLRAES